MELHLILGYFAAILIGLMLGLIGGAVQSLLTSVGLFIWCWTGYGNGLFIVYCWYSCAGGHPQKLWSKPSRRQNRNGFAVPTLTAVYLTRRYLMSAIPDPFSAQSPGPYPELWGSWCFLPLSWFCLNFNDQRSSRRQCNSCGESPIQLSNDHSGGISCWHPNGYCWSRWWLFDHSCLSPLAKLPMKKAVATSLLIITIKSLIGFLGDIQVLEIDWGSPVFCATIHYWYLCWHKVESNYIGEKFKERLWLVCSTDGTDHPTEGRMVLVTLVTLW